MLELVLFFISSVLGFLGHFLYKYSNEFWLVGFLFARNESTFEHLKLGITPILILSIVEKIKLFNNNLLAIKGIQILVFSLIIIIFYYGKRLISKKENALYNIFLFFISLLISYIVSFILLNMVIIPIYIKIIGVVSLLINIFLYFYSFIVNPNCLIFKDPLNPKED